MEMRVAGAQLALQYNVPENTAKILHAIEQAAAAKADILLTPEGGLSGYTPQFDRAAVDAGLAEVRRAAVRAEIGLALGTCFVEEDEKCYNQIRFYRKDGKYLGFHAKILRCGSWDTPPRGEINDYAATELSVFDWTDRYSIGGLICNDFWANPGCTPMPDPHLTQQLAAMNARIIFHAVHGGRDGSDWSKVAWAYHESNLRMRTKAAGIWTVTVDNAFPTDIPCSAPSGVIGPDGNWVCQTASTGETFFVYTIRL